VTRKKEKDFAMKNLLKHCSNESLDRSDLVNLEKEYIEKSLAELTDDVTIDPKGDQERSKRLEEIEELVGTPIAVEWSNQAMALARKSGYTSGKPFND